MKRFVPPYLLAFILTGLTFLSCQRTRSNAAGQNTAVSQKKASCCTGKTPSRFAVKTNAPVPAANLDTVSKVKNN